MEIKLINQEQYDRLLALQNTHPILTFQNNGFEYIDKSKFTEADQKAFDEISNLLKNHISGFSKFFNFYLNKSKEICLRFDYAWSPIFTGVGYLKLTELLNGF